VNEIKSSILEIGALHWVCNDIREKTVLPEVSPMGTCIRILHC
jgi:hypothetical protein